MICLLAALALGAPARPASASTVRYRTDAELVQLSERVVHARAIAQRSERPVPDGPIYTVTTLAVLEDLTGVPGTTLDVWELGGVFGNEFMFVGGAVTYRAGEEVLVCLERGPMGLRSVAMGFSKFTVAPVSRAGAPDGLLARNTGDVLMLGGGAQPGERTLAEFRELAAQVRGARSVAHPGAAAMQPGPLSGFTFLSFGNGLGVRWFEADQGTALNWYQNSTAPNPLLTGDAVPEIQTSLAAWTNPTTASIILQYAGTSHQAQARGPWSGIAANSSVITWEDPQNEISGSTLSLGGGFGFLNCGTLNGTAYNCLVRGYVIFQNAADLSSSFRQTLNFTRVLTHEIGHAIGFGHSDVNPTANIMNSSCCPSTIPTPPALGPDDLNGLNTVYPSVSTGPSMSLDRSVLYFGAVHSGTSLSFQTPAQLVRLRQTGTQNVVTWTAVSNVPWLTVSPASGTGAATLSVGVQFASTLAFPPASTTFTNTGTVTVSYTGAATTTSTITATLRLPGTTAPPFGVLDTPAAGATGLQGSIAVGGWALDDVGIERVEIWRDLQPGETTPPFTSPSPGDPRTGKVFIANATFVDGARPDVEAFSPATPLNYRAGWGYLLLTWGLFDQGNGNYALSVFAFDKEGKSSTLGQRTIGVNNASAARPFGTIDTPGSGGDASGPNFGWGLTPKVNGVATCKIQPSGVQYSIDSGPLQPVVYGDARSDVAGAFPGFSNTATAGGHAIIDWSALANGVHTIGWLITDDCNRADGVGSRFFNVTGGTSLTAAAGTFRLPETLRLKAEATGWESGTGLPSPESTTVLLARGYGELPEIVAPDLAGSRTIEVKQGERIELRLPGGFDRAHQLGPMAQERPLPIGSTWDSSAAIFSWQPAHGFSGPFRFVFGNGTERIRVRIVVTP